MKNLLSKYFIYITMLILALIFIEVKCFSQQVFSVGNKTGMFLSLGGITSDSVFQLPLISAHFPWRDSIGRVRYDKADSCVKFHNGLSWVRLLSPGTNQSSVTASGNQTMVVPPRQMLLSITFIPIAQETITIGTALSGTDVLTATIFNAGIVTTVSFNKVFSRTASTMLYIDGALGYVTYDIRLF